MHGYTIIKKTTVDFPALI